MELLPSQPIATPKKPRPTGKGGGIPKIREDETTGGVGTVTSVSVVTANGVSGTVANATTAPAITLSLGGITPTSVAASGTVTGSNLSGTNTGDQTSIVGITGTKAQFNTAVTDGNILYVGDITQYTDELAQDAVGGILVDSSEINFTYDDATPSITASLVAGSIDESKLDASVNASLDLADSASQPGHTHTAANITDFDTEVSNNTDVAANTAARHAAATVLDSSSIDFTLTGQQITGVVLPAGVDHNSLANLTTGDPHTQYGLKSGTLAQFAATTSAQLAGVISDETGSGSLVFATSPTLVTPALGTPASGVLTNCTGLPTAGILDDAVTYAKIQNVSATSRILGRITSGAGDIEELTAANVATIINSSLDHGTLTGLGDDDHTQYLLRQPAANWVINDSGGDFDGRIEGDNDPNLTVWNAGADAVGMGADNPGLNATGITSGTQFCKLYLVDSGDRNFMGVGIYNSSTTGTAAAAVLRTASDTASMNFQSHCSARTLSRWGVTIGGWNEFLSVTGSGFALGSSAGTPVIIGTASVSRIEMDGSTELVINQSGVDYDFRLEGDTLTHMAFFDASAATENIALLATGAPNWQSMDRGIFIGNMTTAPTGNPTSGIYVYVDGGAGKARGGSGTITTWAPANPHCPVCGYDYIHEWENEAYNQKYLAVCMKCLTDEIGERAYILRQK